MKGIGTWVMLTTQPPAKRQPTAPDSRLPMPAISVVKSSPEISPFSAVGMAAVVVSNLASWGGPLWLPGGDLCQCGSTRRLLWRPGLNSLFDRMTDDIYVDGGFEIRLDEALQVKSHAALLRQFLPSCMRQACTSAAESWQCLAVRSFRTKMKANTC